MSDFMLIGVHAPSQASEEGWKALCAIRWAWVRPPFMQNLFPGCAGVMLEGTMTRV